ncbi:patatin-like phospholipase family protein [Paenibacillus alkalitolerans]|uniref:patatin-like phospholipase family protein n=1 Tax=Paenibacillus alkalitolerans TaxID=2799335 RepID=UPI0018F3862E|nr:patatin-like phospholipase family protein [Paenibacillus alkalitolerans]
MRVNAVFQGGGVKGIGLVGGIYAAERRGITFHQVAGTSVGAVVAAFLAAGYSADEMKNIILNTNFRRFISKDWFHYLNGFGQVVRLFVKKGLYSGDPLEEWVSEHLKARGIRTFGDLEANKLRVVASDISQGKMLVLPEDISNYGRDPSDFPVARAVRMSAALPYFFDPVILKHRNPKERGRGIEKESYYIVDGGILSNYPLWIFDKELNEIPPKVPTLGFQLVGKKPDQPYPINGPVSMFNALFSTMMGAHDERYIEKHNRFRTVKIPSHMVHTTEFSITHEQMMELFDSGVRAGGEFFDRWTYSGYSLEMDKWIHTINPKAAVTGKGGKGYTVREEMKTHEPPLPKAE